MHLQHPHEWFVWAKLGFSWKWKLKRKVDRNKTWLNYPRGNKCPTLSVQKVNKRTTLPPNTINLKPAPENEKTCAHMSSFPFTCCRTLTIDDFSASIRPDWDTPRDGGQEWCSTWISSRILASKDLVDRDNCFWRSFDSYWAVVHL